MAEDLTQQLQTNVADSECFLLQWDESVDTSDTAQPCIFIRMMFTDMTEKEELLTLLPMKERTRGEFIFQAFKNFMGKTTSSWCVNCNIDGCLLPMCITAVRFYVQYQGLHYSLNACDALCYIKYTQCLYY